jgi:hypothetical protein
MSEETKTDHDGRISSSDFYGAFIAYLHREEINLNPTKRIVGMGVRALGFNLVHSNGSWIKGITLEKPSSEDMRAPSR